MSASHQPLCAQSATLDVLGSDYLRTARAGGADLTEALLRHGVRNGSVPVISVLGIELSTTLLGAVVVESVFTLPGLGSMLLTGIAAARLPEHPGGPLREHAVRADRRLRRRRRPAHHRSAPAHERHGDRREPRAPARGDGPSGGSSRGAGRRHPVAVGSPARDRWPAPASGSSSSSRSCRCSGCRTTRATPRGGRLEGPGGDALARHRPARSRPAHRSSWSARGSRWSSASGAVVVGAAIGMPRRARRGVRQPLARRHPLGAAIDVVDRLPAAPARDAVRGSDRGLARLGDLRDRARRCQPSSPGSPGSSPSGSCAAVHRPPRARRGTGWPGIVWPARPAEHLAHAGVNLALPVRRRRARRGEPVVPRASARRRPTRPGDGCCRKRRARCVTAPVGALAPGHRARRSS